MQTVLLTWGALSILAFLFVWALFSVGKRGDDETWH